LGLGEQNLLHSAVHDAIEPAEPAEGRLSTPALSPVTSTSKGTDCASQHLSGQTCVVTTQLLDFRYGRSRL
jgi:hypothetical protein